jgi:hypothetical protein
MVTTEEKNSHPNWRLPERVFFTGKTYIHPGSSGKMSEKGLRSATPWSTLTPASKVCLGTF